MASCALVAATHALEAAYGAAAVGDSLEAWASDEERAAERAPQGADAQAARGDGGDEAVRRSLEKLHGQYQGTAPEAGGGGGEKVREAGASGRTRQLRPPSALKRPVWRGAGAKALASTPAAAAAGAGARRAKSKAKQQVKRPTQQGAGADATDGWEEEVRGLFARVGAKVEGGDVPTKPSAARGGGGGGGSGGSGDVDGDDDAEAVAGPGSSAAELEETELAQRAAELEDEMTRLHEARVRLHLRNEEQSLRRRAADSLGRFREELTGELEERLRGLAGERQAKLDAANAYRQRVQEEIAALHATLGQLAAKTAGLSAAYDERVTNLRAEYAEVVREFKRRLEGDIRAKLAAKAKRLLAQAPTLEL